MKAHGAEASWEGCKLAVGNGEEKFIFLPLLVTEYEA